MKTNRFAWISILAALFLAASCSGVMDQGKLASTGPTGSVQLAIPGISPRLQAAIDKQNGTKSAPSVNSLVASEKSRAFIVANAVQVAFYKDGMYHHDSYFYPNALMQAPNSVPVASENLDAGSWAVRVYLYNNFSSQPTSTSPLTSFTVTAGTSTMVNVTCIPSLVSGMSNYNVTEATALTLYPNAAWIMNSSGPPVTGSEHWFQILASSPTFFTVINAKSVSGYGSQPWFIVSDASGNYLGQAQPDLTGLSSLQFPSSPGAYYYVGVIDAGAGPSLAINLWYNDGLAPTFNGNIDTFGVWKDFILESNTVNQHDFQVQSGVSYKIGWNDGYSYGGDGTKTKDLLVTIAGLSSGYLATSLDSAFDFDGSMSGFKGPAHILNASMDEVVRLSAGEYSTGSPAGTYALKVVPLNVHNSLFKLPGAADTFGKYSSQSDVETYLNSPMGDLLPGWKLELDGKAAGENDGAAFDLGSGSLHFLGNPSQTRGSDWSQAASQEGFMYTVTPNTVLDVNFTINAFDDQFGGYSSPYNGNDAPLNVWIKFNDGWHLLAAYTTGYNAYEYFQGNLSLGVTYDTTDMSNAGASSLQLASRKTVDGYEMNPGTVIQGVKVESRGSYWDVTVNHVTFIE